ncbi:hypothetical protein ABPG73_020812 [Tetrahymena malaccensis]
MSVDLESYNMSDFQQLRESIIQNTQQYLELWDLSQKNMIDIEKIDDMTVKIEKKTQETRQLWENAVASRGSTLPKKLKMQYIKYLIDVTPHKDEGFALLRKYENDLQNYRENEFKNYDCNNNKTGKESSFDNEKMRNIKREIITVQNNHEIPRSAFILKVLGFVFFIIIIGLNSLEWHMSADNFTDHLKNLRKISQTNQLQTESQSLVSYIQDLSFLQYQQYQIDQQNLPQNQKDQLRDNIQKNKQNYLIGLQESITNIQNITDNLKNNFTTKINDYEKTMIQVYTGVDEKQTIDSSVQSVNQNITLLASQILSVSQQGDLSKAFSYYSNQSTNEGEQQRQNVQYILLNLLNDIPIQQQKLYLEFVEDFSNETQEVADTNTIMLVFILFIVFQIVFILAWLIMKVGKQRQKAYKKLLKIPVDTQARLYEQCKSLLTIQLGVNETEVVNKVKNHNKDGYQHFVEEESNEDAGISNKDNNDDLLNSEVDEDERKKHLYNVYKTKVLVSTAILVFLMIIYFISNFLVQKYLANDMQLYVHVDNSTSISESFYMFSDNTFHMNLLNWTLPVVHQNSYDIFKLNVLSMEEKEKEISDFDSHINNKPMRKIFDKIMKKDPCQVIADGSTKVYTAEECEEFGNGVIKNGLSNGMELFIKVAREALTQIQATHNSTQVVVRDSILQDPKIQEARALQRIYIKEGLLVLKDQLRQQMEKEMNTFLKWKQFSWYGGFIIILITYLQLHFKLIKEIPIGILRARKSLSIVPVDNL